MGTVVTQYDRVVSPTQHKPNSLGSFSGKKMELMFSCSKLNNTKAAEGKVVTQDEGWRLIPTGYILTRNMVYFHVIGCVPR